MAFSFPSGEPGSLVSLFLVRLLPSYFSRTFYMLMEPGEVQLAAVLGLIMKHTV